MATLFVDRAGAELRLDGRALALYQDGERQRTVPLALLDRIVARGELLLDTSVISAAASAGISLLFLSGRTTRRIAIVLGAPHHDARIRLRQFAAERDDAFRAGAAAALVRAKLRRQLRLIQRAQAERPDLRKPLTDAARTLAQCLCDAESGGAPERLRGLEGAGSAAYFGGFTRLFAPELAFTGRNRRPPRDPVNAALSLSYTLLHHEAVATAYGCGLDPYIGFFHRPAFARESLACDLIEPFRPAADAWVLDMFRSRRLRAEDFSLDKGACLLKKAGRGRFYESWAGYAHGTRTRLRRFCRRIVRALPEGLWDDGEPATDEEDAF